MSTAVRPQAPVCESVPQGSSENTNTINIRKMKSTRDRRCSLTMTAGRRPTESIEEEKVESATLIFSYWRADELSSVSSVRSGKAMRDM